MSIEDIVLVSTVREDIRSHALQVDPAEIPLRVEAEQLCALGLEIPDHLRFPKNEGSSTVDLERVSAHESDDELPVSPSRHSFEKSVDDWTDECVQADGGAPRNMSMLKGEPARPTKKRRGNRGAVAAMRMVKKGKEVLMVNNMGIQWDDPEEDDNGVAICTSTPNSKSLTVPASEELTDVLPVTSEPESAAPPVLPCYSVGWGVSLPFGQPLPQCSECECRFNALIAWSGRSDPRETGVVCLGHGLSKLRDPVLNWTIDRRYRFISREHEAALRAFLA